MVDAGSQQGTHDNIEIGGCGGRRRQLGNLVGRPKQRMPAMGATNPDKFDVLGRGECGLTTLKLGGAGAQREPQRGRLRQPCKHGKSAVRGSEIWGSARAAPEQRQSSTSTRAEPEQRQSSTRAAPEQHQSSTKAAADRAVLVWFALDLLLFCNSAGLLPGWLWGLLFKVFWQPSRTLMNGEEISSGWVGGRVDGYVAIYV